MNNLFKQLKDNSEIEIDRSLRKKLDILEIDNKRMMLLENMKCHNISNSEFYDDQGQCSLETIDVNNLVGFCRADMTDIKNWLESLERLHKFANFSMYTGKQKYEQFLNEIEYCNETFGLPEVIELDGFYYITGNGKHRLTIAKCIGIKKVSACVKRIGK